MSLHTGAHIHTNSLEIDTIVHVIIGSFRIEVLTLVQNITENRLRHARGPVHFTSSLLHLLYIYCERHKQKKVVIYFTCKTFKILIFIWLMKSFLF